MDPTSHTPLEFGPNMSCCDDRCIVYDVPERGYSIEYPEGQFVALDTPHQAARHVIHHHHDEFEAMYRIGVAQGALIIALPSVLHKHSSFDRQVMHESASVTCVWSFIHPSIHLRIWTNKDCMDGPAEGSVNLPRDMILWGDVTSLVSRRPGYLRASRAWEQRSSTTHPPAGRTQRTGEVAEPTPGGRRLTTCMHQT